MDYFTRIQKAIDYIETNLRKEISTNDVAKNACFSKFHFHRIFQAVVGESISDYLRKRRLTCAGNDLILTNKRIIDIAFEYRFESQESFSRSFKKLFRVTPGQYRLRKRSSILSEKKIITPKKLEHLQGGITMQPKIVTKNTFMVVGIRGKSSLKNNTIPKMWQDFFPRITEIKHQTNNGSYGICEQIPDFDMREFSAETEFSEVVSVEVSKFEDIPNGMISKTIPEYTYAVFTHKGSLGTLRDTYDYIYGTWLPNSKYEFGNAEDFEFYNEKFIGIDNPESEMYIYVPIIEKK